MKQELGLHLDEAPLTVLHVDDDSEFGELAAVYLERELPNATILTETDPREAIETIEERNIDCVVSDFDMPEMNGLSLLSKVRINHATLPFILFTGKGSEEVAADAIDAGVTAYMQKETSTEQYTVLANKIVNAVVSARTDEERRALRAGVEQVNSAVAVATDGMRIRYVNQRFNELTGVSQQDVFESAVSVVDVLVGLGFDRDKIKSQLDGEGNWIGRTEEGGVISEYRLTEVLDVDDEVRQLVLAVTDKEQNEVMELEADSVLQRINDGFFSLNDEWEFTYVNPAGEEILQNDADTLLGNTIWEMYPEVEDSRFTEQYQEAFETQRSVKFQEYYPPHDEEYTVRVYPSESGISVYFNTLSEQQKQEKALSDLYEVTSQPNTGSEEKINQVLKIGREYLDIDYAMVNKVDSEELVVQYSNGVDGDFGVGTTCPIGKSYCRECVVSDDLLDVYDAAESGWQNESVYTELDLQSYIGSKVLIDSKVYGTVCFMSYDSRDEPFTDEERQFVELLSQWVNYELEEDYHQTKLESQNEYLREFAGFVAHDLRNPLAIAKGRVDMIEETEDLSYLDAVRSNLNRIDQIIDDVLDLARDGKQVDDEDKAAVDLCTIAERAWSNVKTDEATLVCEASHVLKADAGKLVQLFENLFRNAVTHIEGAVEVEVGVTGDGGFYVSDDGPGVSEETLEELFDLGYTSEDTGSGLGLAIVERIAIAHNWDVDVMNDSDGGLRFGFRNVWVPETNELRSHLNTDAVESLGD